MELFIVTTIIALLAAASVAGLTHDSRDSADWRPSHQGERRRR